MIYYPKSQITPNLYSSGEMTYVGSQTSYTGYYFSTIDNKFYTGRFPGDGENLELSSISTSNTATTTEAFESQNPEDSRFYPENVDYSNLKQLRYNQGLVNAPTQFYPQPTKQDYVTGEITRYFSKKANENIFYETSQLVSNKYYIGFSLPWKISGDKNIVSETNKKIVLLKEQQYQISGLGAYLYFNYLQFYK